MKADDAPKPIDLAKEPDFSLGPATIRPSSREVADEIVEPRVMQVLVALAQRKGQVVSRDTLVSLCWNSRAIGEDAIQRAIARVRKLGDTSGAFTIETVSRVGYRLKSDDVSPPAPATPPEPILAVLPFDNLSDDREMQFFSDGMSDEILQSLARTRRMKVIGRMSAFQFRGDRKSEAAAVLGATHILDGSVRRSGTRIRVSTQLVEASRTVSIWNAQYDSDVSDVLNLQTQIANAIASALHIQLDQRPAHAVDPVAYDLWLQARSMKFQDPTARSAGAIAALLERTVNLLPDFASAWANLASARAMMLPGLHDAIGTPEHTAAVAAANRALAIDPSCAEAHQALASLMLSFGAYEAKLELLERALSLAPNDAFAAVDYAAALISVGRVREALDYCRVALKLEPKAQTPHFVSIHAVALCSTGNVDAAINVIDDLWKRSQRSYAIWYAWSWIHSARTGYGEWQTIIDKNPPPDLEQHIAEAAFLRHVVATLALPTPDRSMGARMFLGSHNPFLWIGIAKFAAQAGCMDEVFEAFEDAFNQGRPLVAPGVGEIGFPKAMQSGAFFVFDGAALRADSRFPRLCARLNLVDYWMTSGLWPDCAEEVPYDFRAECEKALKELGR